MQLSRFVVKYEDVRPGEHVLYNVLTDHYIGVDQETLQAVGRWSQGETPTSDEAETADVLESEGFVVAGRGDDDEALRSHLEKASEGIPGSVYVTLMPTLACNLACTYCFQKEHPAFNRMSPESEAAAIEFILRRVDASSSRKLCVHYFGGEPLTRKDFVLRTAQIFSSAMRARGGEFSWEITTNGINLDRPFVDALTPLGDGSIKVTLDGDKESHDKGRVWRNGKGTFDEIFRNLCEVAGHVKLRVGGNFRPGEAASYERLLSRMEEAGLPGKLLAIKFKPVVDTTRQSGGTCTGCSHGTEAEEVQTLVQLNRSVQKKKLGAINHETLEAMLGPCELHWKNSFIIDPDGLVYKCPAVAGRPEMATGNVADATPQKVAPLVALRPWEKCGDCPYLPVCVGGCLGARYLQTGRTDEVFCKLDQFEASFRETIPARYLAELGDEGWHSAAPTPHPETRP